jgi:lipoyl(octanoyl) transferase
MAIIPSGIEESLDAPEGARDVSTSLDMTARLFAALLIYHDDTAHSAAMNMSIDEALLERAAVPSIRFYRWHSPALSFGYFGKFANVPNNAGERDLVRRWTGGGIVFHGEDLTYSIVIPCSDRTFAESSISIYAAVHAAMRDALIANGQRAELAAVAVFNPRGNEDSAVGDCRFSCFANPVRADVMIDNRKVAGAGQRRTRQGLLQQGSIQGVNFGNGFAEQFVRALAHNLETRTLPGSVERRAQEIAAEKYGTEDWLRKR